MDGRITRGAPDWQIEVQKEHLQRDYLRFAEDQRLMRRASPTVLGRFLARQLPKTWPRSTQRMTDVEKDVGTGGVKWARERAYWYEFPPLEACRAAWDKKYGGPFDWPKDEAETERQSGDKDGDPY